MLAYLVQHPAVSDSIEGVRLWWLRDTRVSTQELQEALDDLAEKGWLLKRGDRPETRIYSLNARDREAVERYVREGGRSDG